MCVSFFFYLLGFNVAFKHLRSYRDGAYTCSSGILTNVLPHRNAMQQTQGMTPPPRHSIQTQDRPVVVLSVGVELAYTTTHLNILVRILPLPSAHISERSTL